MVPVFRHLPFIRGGGESTSKYTQGNKCYNRRNTRQGTGTYIEERIVVQKIYGKTSEYYISNMIAFHMIGTQVNSELGNYLDPRQGPGCAQYNPAVNKRERYWCQMIGQAVVLALFMEELCCDMGNGKCGMGMQRKGACSCRTRRMEPKDERQMRVSKVSQNRVNQQKEGVLYH